MAGELRLTEPTDIVLRRAFAPWHKRTMGLAVGLTCALGTAGVTMFHVVAAPPDAPNLELLRAFFSGYEVSLWGACVGAWWSFVAGFVGGWFIAFLMNLWLATWLMVVRARNDLSQTTDFLDHI